MKKFFLFTSFVLFCCVTSYAAADKFQPGTYYGKETSSGKSPCKGKTTRLCAVINVTTSPLSTTVSAVTETVTNSNGSVISNSVTYTDSKSVEVVKTEIVVKHSQNGAIFEN